MKNPILFKDKVARIVLFAIVFFLLGNLISKVNGYNAVNPQAEIRKNDRAKYVEGEVLVEFKSKVSRNAVDAIAESLLSSVAKRFNALKKFESREYALFSSKHKTTQQMIQSLTKNPQVEAVSPNFFLHVDSNIPNDPNFSYLWGLHNIGQTGGPADIDINAPEAWDVTTGSSSVIVGVIDTGIDYNHPDLIPNLWMNPNEVVDGVDNDGNGYVDDIYGINAITGSGDPWDDHGHGTHCAGTIGAAGNNGLGVVGINWDVSIIGTKFLDESGYGTDADAIECIDYLIDLKTTYEQNVVAANASFGGGDYDPVMESAIEAMGNAGIIFCAAAGNDWTDNDDIPHYPSSYECSNIIAVTAVDYMGWQNFNYGATSVDLAAPGIEILSTIPAVYFPQSGDIFFDDTESGAGNWVTGGVNNSWAIATDQEIFEDPLFPVPSPPHFWSDSPGTYYLPDTDSWLMNASDIDLSGYVGQPLYLGFGSAMLLEPDAPVDHGYVEVSGDGGSTWYSLADFAQAGFYWYIPWNFLIPDSVKTTHFRFRFHLVTDFSIEYDGWLIDDVGIGTADYYGYSFKSGTSMATPHVTGAVALLASRFPSETVEERKDRILNNVTPLPSLVDTCVTEGMLNLNQAFCQPGLPRNPLPGNFESGVSPNTILDWDDCPGAVSYDVYFGTSSSPSFVENVLASSYNPGPLSTNTDYYWRIIALNSCGNSPGPEWIFTTGGCPVPAVPAKPLPLDQSINIPLDINLDWDDCAGADSYDVYFGTIPSPPFVENVPTSSYELGPLNSNTTYYWKIVAKNFCGESPGPDWQFTTREESVYAEYYVFDGHDYDGDGKSDISLFRPSDGTWLLRGIGVYSYGVPGDIPVPGDYDGDGITDIAVWRPSNGTWYLKDIGAYTFGVAGDIPVPGDYNGDGITDIAVWRPSNGTWYLRQIRAYTYGASGDIPVPGDYDGDGITDIAVWRPSNGTWYLRQIRAYTYGASGDIPVPGDYDGDGLTDIAVWRPSNGTWYLRQVSAYSYGILGDIPLVR